VGTRSFANHDGQSIHPVAFARKRDVDPIIPVAAVVLLVAFWSICSLPNQVEAESDTSPLHVTRVRKGRQ
jgi:hypothetical protein